MNTGLELEGLSRLAAGDQEYISAPVVTSVIGVGLLQSMVSPMDLTLGFGRPVIVTVSVAVQPELEVPVTMSVTLLPVPICQGLADNESVTSEPGCQ